jgi:pilus assembly protein Flp/PilA
MQVLALPLHLQLLACSHSHKVGYDRRRKTMKALILSSISRLHNDEAGQGIVEYMLIIALVAFAATAGMSSLASGVNSAMTKIASVLGVYIS